MTRIDLHGFEPSAERAQAIDAWMHDQLCQSLAHVAEQCRGPAPAIAATLDPVIARLSGGGRIAPEAFGRYFELVEALSGGALDEGLDHAQALAAVAPRGVEMSVLAMGTANAAGIEDVFRARLGKDSWLFTSVSEAERESFARLLDRGLDILARGVPALHAELRQIMHVALLSQGDDAAEVEFDGASHYQFWGLVVLNPKYHTTPIEVAEVLAHEAGHSMLFGMMQDELLVLNPYGERYPSPLRPDPRPMDGIFHATFVSARMALAMEALAASGILDAQETAAAREAAGRDRENFAEGDGVLQRHGRLTETGLRIITAARDWMARPPRV
jgi:HEXXH motif-containing protein